MTVEGNGTGVGNGPVDGPVGSNGKRGRGRPRKLDGERLGVVWRMRTTEGMGEMMERVAARHRMGVSEWMRAVLEGEVAEEMAEEAAEKARDSITERSE